MDTYIVDHDANDISDIKGIHKYVMKNIKYNINVWIQQASI